jgi:hypothetical protein
MPFSLGVNMLQVPELSLNLKKEQRLLVFVFAYGTG